MIKSPEINTSWTKWAINFLVGALWLTLTGSYFDISSKVREAEKEVNLVRTEINRDLNVVKVEMGEMRTHIPIIREELATIKRLLERMDGRTR